MFRYAKNVRLASFLALTCSLRLSLALSGSYWISPCLFLALYGSLWLPLWLSLALTATLWHTLALSGSLLLSNFAYTALDRLTEPFLGSHRRCHDDALSPALTGMTHTGIEKLISRFWTQNCHFCVCYPWEATMRFTRMGEKVWLHSQSIRLRWKKLPKYFPIYKATVYHRTIYMKHPVST